MKCDDCLEKDGKHCKIFGELLPDDAASCRHYEKVGGEKG